jgi:DNA polymerase III alpha subunit
MKTDLYGQQIYTENDICELYLKDPLRNLKEVLVEKPIQFADILVLSNLPNTTVYTDPQLTIDEFDYNLQNNWLMPEEYKNFDIAKYVLDLCQNDEELQRVGEELILFQEREMFDLLRYLKYFVDTMRANNIVWGVGRGSSVASFVLFLIGVHRINSLYYDLSIEEFLK